MNNPSYLNKAGWIFLIGMDSFFFFLTLTKEKQVQNQKSFDLKTNRNIKRECGTEEKQDTIPDSFAQVKHFIESDYLKPLRLDTIAHLFGMSKSKLCQGVRNISIPPLLNIN